MTISTIWGAAGTVISIFLMIGAGLFIAWRKWITPEGAKAIPRIIINIAIPCMIVYFFSSDITRELLFSSWLPLLIVFITTPVLFLIGKLVGIIFRVPKGRRGVFNALFTFSNSVFIGFPVAQALFGDKGMPFAIFYYFANTTFFWTLGYYAIRKDGDFLAGKRNRVAITDILKKLITPPIITIAVMFAVILSGVKFPIVVFGLNITEPIISTAKYINGITTPMSLIFMGCMIFWAGKEGVTYERDVTPVLIGRFIVAPALCFLASCTAILLFSGRIASLDLTLMRNVFTVQAGLPVMTSTAIIAELYGAETRYATRSYFWTTLISLLTIPAYMLLFQYL